MRKHICITVIVFIAACLAFASTASADSVGVSVTSPATVVAGSAFVVDVGISGVTDLYDFQLDLNFNPAVLSATGVTEGAFLAGAGTTYFIAGTTDNTLGTIAASADTLLSAISGASGNGTLLQFTFTALATGSSDLTPANIILQDSAGNLIDATFSGTQVTVTQSVATPEPNSLLLLFTALGLIVVFASLNRA